MFDEEQCGWERSPFKEHFPFIGFDANDIARLREDLTIRTAHIFDDLLLITPNVTVFTHALGGGRAGGQRHARCRLSVNRQNGLRSGRREI
jgi:hypothetical protein